MSHKPLMIYDFDGVFNPLNFTKEYIGENEHPDIIEIAYPSAKDWKITRDEVDTDEYYGNDLQDEIVETSSGRKFSIQWGSLLVDDINSFIKEGLARHVMLTTWKEDSVTKLNPRMGLSIEEFIPPTSSSGDRFYRHSDDAYQLGKSDALEDWLEEEYGSDDRPPIVWFDDVATFYFSGEKPIHDPVKYFKSPAVKAFLTRPDKGISRKQWAESVAFVRSHSTL